MSEKIKLEFQLYDWMEDHEVNNDNNSDIDDEEEILGDFIIHSFGRCDDGRSVYAKIIGYTPYFYLLLPKKLQERSAGYLEDMIKKKLLNYLKGKDNKKVFYKYKPTLKEVQLVKLKCAEGFTNDKEYYFVRLVFSNSEGMRKFKSYFENNDISIPYIEELSKPTKFKLYEANLPPMLRCFHIREISGCSWVETKEYKLIENEDEKESYCNIEIIVDWRKLNPIKKDHNAPLRICSFDIECNSIDGEFPQAKREGDCVIQIGATYTYLGKSIPYRQYIACLGETASIENIIVETCETEQDLMLKFLDEINNNDCDIITGYNIFFFDEKYMYDRCKYILNIDKDMAYMSKLKKYKCNFKEMNLSSAAYGENKFYFWETPGRIHIDLMKDIQKTYKLPVYKLDYVASNFIRGEVEYYNILENNNFELKCKSVNDILPGDYIHLEVMKGFISDDVGEKYLVLSVDSDNLKIIVKGDDFLDLELQTAKQGGIINWSQAKDDVGPKDIFKLQKGTPQDRAIVAKYCVKDCKLVSLLINKLEVVTKNLEMANVCFVPLSYLFIRGQGIKIFSLCLREFRKHKYAFPVLKISKNYKCLNCNHEFIDKWDCPKCKSKKKQEIETESNSYEGAIVFDPVPKVEYEALATKDYMSLYPASIMQKNMSHETIVDDPEFDNLPGITYYNAQFKENDGTIQYRRFAKKDNKLGVIPLILDNLLKERKAIKKLMAIEKDPFKAKILDAKQLAVKITANSLYGQLGASISQVCQRDIAACTTSTGREMLILAKKYDEETLPWIINGLKYFYNTEQEDKVNHLYDLELKARNDEKLINNLKKYITKDINNLTFQPVIRYGDSVIGKTPLLLKNKLTNNILIINIDSLGNKFKPMIREHAIFDNKESCEIYNLQTWTSKGWTNISRVIRHKLSPHKKLFKITTSEGYIVVSDDHSLLTIEGKEIKPTELKINQSIMHSFPSINELKNYNINTSYKSNELIEMNNYIKNIINNTNYKIGNKILNIEEYNEECNYVYDLTTENHHFQAGVGSIIVHNTDSIFSCYRFRENTVKVPYEESLILWKKIIKFGRELIEPYFGSKERELFNDIYNQYYSDEKIINLQLPEPPKTIPESTHYAIILPLEERIKQFIKEYVEESYLPWLWTLAELVEKNYTNMFDIKLTQWAEHQLNKIKCVCEDFVENRRNYILKPIMDHIKTIFNNKYEIPDDKTILNFSSRFIKTNENAFPFSHEIKLSFDEIYKQSKILMLKTIKEKWIYSGEKKEILKIINKFINDVSDEQTNGDNNKFMHYINEFISNNKNLDITTMTNMLIQNLENDNNMNIKFNLEKLENHTQNFIELYIKNNGKKLLDNIVEEFVEEVINIKFSDDKQNHYQYVINFIKNNMRKTNNINEYVYYWIQPRWDFDQNKNKLYYIDIYEGGQSITDKRTLDYGMELGKLSGEIIKSRLPFPHDCEYEKTFWPFAIPTKKKYVGNKYEFNPNKYKLDFNGIVLKRRDNAPIVKEICGGIIDYLINHRSPQGARDYVINCLDKMFNDKYNIKYFLTSKTLKSKESYKNWKTQPHIYLADKISKRDPGNIPQSGDRIEFAVIKVPTPTDGSKLLQGDMIETPQYIKDNELEINYLFYLTNQIMNPALQFLELVDPNAIDIFNQFINKYSLPKINKKTKKNINITNTKINTNTNTKTKTKNNNNNTINIEVYSNSNNDISNNMIKGSNLAIRLLEENNTPLPYKSKKLNIRALKLKIFKLIDEINESLENNITITPMENFEKLFHTKSFSHNNNDIEI